MIAVAIFSQHLRGFARCATKRLSGAFASEGFAFLLFEQAWVVVVLVMADVAVVLAAAKVVAKAVVALTRTTGRLKCQTARRSLRRRGSSSMSSRDAQHPFAAALSGDAVCSRLLGRLHRLSMGMR